MSEEQIITHEEIKTQEAPKVDQEVQVFEQLQREFMQLCAQAGEKNYIIARETDALQKIYARIRRVDKKAGNIVRARQLQQQAHEAAQEQHKKAAASTTTPLEVVK